LSKITIILQARTGSKRLPGKTLSKIEGKFLIWHIINRLKKVKSVDQIILATTKKTEDDILEKIGLQNNIFIFRGNSNNVLKRYYHCAKKFDADPIIRITGDCPLLDPLLIDQMIEFYLTHNYDYVSNTIKPTYPDGLDVEIFSFKILEKLMNKVSKQSDKEHVTSYIIENIKDFKVFNYENKTDLSDIRLTVDEKQDLKLIRKIFSLLQPKIIFSLNDIMKIINQNPKIIEMNKGIFRNEGYFISKNAD